MMNAAQLEHLTEIDLSQVNHIIEQQLQSDIPLIQQVAKHIFQSGGKRLRPTLVVLGAQLFGYSGDDHYQLAAVVELIHTATLLHDDVVDHSEQRRGHPSANILFGNGASVLVGDFLYSRSFQMMVEIQNLPILSVLARAANVIAEGEVMQLTNSHDSSISEARYLETIQRKTAALFEAATQLGAILCGRPDEEITAMAQFGHHLGIAFQLIDDALDYGASGENIGKNLGDDLAEGKITLPIIRALKQTAPEQASVLHEAIKHGDHKNFQKVIKVIASTDAIEYTYALAQKHAEFAQQALEIFPASELRSILDKAASFAVERSF